MFMRAIRSNEPLYGNFAQIEANSPSMVSNRECVKQNGTKDHCNDKHLNLDVYIHDYHY